MSEEKKAQPKPELSQADQARIKERKEHEALLKKVDEHSKLDWNTLHHNLDLAKKARDGLGPQVKKLNDAIALIEMAMIKKQQPTA